MASAPRSLSPPALLAFAFLVAYPVALVLQGIDFSDMGFNLANQRMLLVDPGAYVHGHLFYLSNLLGGLWQSASEGLGLLGARLGWVALVLATALAAGLALHRRVPELLLLAGLCVALAWSTLIGVVWIDYNHVSALFATLAAAMLAHAGALRAAAAGALVACAAAARLPSIVLVGLALVLVLPGAGEGPALRGRALRLGAFALGTLAGLAALAVLMSLLGHLDAYLGALGQRFTATQDNPGYDYSAGSLLASLLSDYRQILLCAALATPVLAAIGLALQLALPVRLALLAALAAYLVVFATPSPPAIAAGALAALVRVAARAQLARDAGAAGQLLDALCIGAAATIFATLLPRQLVWLVPAVLLVVLGAGAVLSADLERRRLAVLAILAMVLTPLGSSNGVYNAIFGMWFALPVALWLAWDPGERLSPRAAQALRVAVLVVLPALLATALARSWTGPYRDFPDRAALDTTADHPYLAGVLTSAGRAAVTNELVIALERFVRPGDPLLVHGGCALVHVLTETRPALASHWPDVYAPAVFARRLDDLAAASGGPPTIVVSRGSCRRSAWPYEKAYGPHERAAWVKLERFLDDNGYEQRWRNEFFTLWTAPG